MSESTTLTPEIIEFFKNNAWPLVFDNLFENPAFIGIMAAIAFAILCWGVSHLISLNLTLDFGGKERAYNEGYLEGFKKAIEELSRNPNETRRETE